MTDSHTEQKLEPFRAIPLVIQSWRTLIDDPEYLARLAGPWVLGLALLAAVGGASAPGPVYGPGDMRGPMMPAWLGLYGLILLIAVFAAYGAIGAAWIRHLGLGERIDGIIAPLSKYAMRLIGYSLLLMLVVTVGLLIVGIVVAVFASLGGRVAPFVFAVIFLPALIFVGVRISFFYVEIAKSEESFDFMGGLRASWALSEGKFWRLLGGFILVSLPFVVLGAVIETVIRGIPSVLLSILFGLILIVIQLFSMLAPLSFATLAHNALTKPDAA